MEFIPGFCQGITRVLISYPFDYIRTNIQASNIKPIAYIQQLPSYRILYSGVSVPLITVSIDRAISFKLYEHLLRDRKISPYIAGGCCGIVSSCINQPFTYIMNNYIVRKNTHTAISISQFAKTYIKLDKRLMTGYSTEFVKSVMASSIYMGTYGFIRQKYGNTPVITACNAMISSIVLWTIIYPLETIKIIQQTSNKSVGTILTTEKGRCSMPYINLWRGIGLIYLRTIPSSVLGMLVYEQVKALFK